MRRPQQPDPLTERLWDAIMLLAVISVLIEVLR